MKLAKFMALPKFMNKNMWLVLLFIVLIVVLYARSNTYDGFAPAPPKPTSPTPISQTCEKAKSEADDLKRKKVKLDADIPPKRRERNISERELKKLEDDLKKLEDDLNTTEKDIMTNNKLRIDLKCK